MPLWFRSVNILAAQFVDSYGSLLPRIPGMEPSVERFKPRLTGRMQLSAECGRPSPGDGVSRAQCVCHQIRGGMQSPAEPGGCAWSLIAAASLDGLWL